MEIAVIYWSGTGNTQMMAEAVAEGIKEAGAEAVVKSVSEITPDEAWLQRHGRGSFGRN